MCIVKFCLPTSVLRQIKTIKVKHRADIFLTSSPSLCIHFSDYSNKRYF